MSQTVTQTQYLRQQQQAANISTYGNNTDTNDDTNVDIDIDKIILYPSDHSPYSQEYETLLTRVGSPISHFKYNYSYLTTQGSVKFI